MRSDVDRRITDLDGMHAPDLRGDIVRRAELPEDRSSELVHGSGRPLRRLTAAAVALVVFAAGLLFLRAAFEPPEAVDTPTPPPAPSLWDDLEPGVLTPMPDPPFDRQGAVEAWGGGGFFMWGGQAGDGRPHQDDGAFFDAAAREWRSTAPSPLSARSFARGVWAGDRFVIWSGTTGDWPGGGEPMTDGAAYDPATDRWTPIAAGPAIGHIPLTATWTGEEIVFAGGYEGETDAVAYDPETGSWRSLPEMPIALNDGEGVWTGSEVVVFGAFLAAGNNYKTPATGAAYDPEADSWRPLPDSDLVPNAQRIIWDGSRLVAMDYGLRVQTLDDDAGRWIDLPRLPTNACEGSPLPSSDGGTLLTEFCGELVELPGGSDRWHVVSGRGEQGRPPYATPIAADGAFLLLGSDSAGAGVAMWAYRPSLQTTGARAAWDVAAAFAALRSHYPYDPDHIGEEILAQLQPLLSAEALAEYEDRVTSGLPRLWAYYYGFEVVEVGGRGAPFVVVIRFAADERFAERLTIGPGVGLDGLEHDMVILHAEPATA